MLTMDSPVPQTSSFYVLRGREQGRPYVAAVFSDLHSAAAYNRRSKHELVVEPTTCSAWPLYVVEWMDEDGQLKLDYVDREGLLEEIEHVERIEGDHVYMVVFKVPCDWLGHPRDLGSNFMGRLNSLTVDNWFLDAYYDAGRDEFDWF